MIGKTIGPYHVVAKLGEGGMGEVYRATDTNLKRQVAIKVLPAAVVGDAERLARFQREAEVLASLNHPNTAQIHGLEKSDGQTALVMELVEGPTLADLIAGADTRGRESTLDAEGEASVRSARGGGSPRGLPIEEALPIAKQIAEALEAAHEQGIIHRDLKPANIKVKDDGTVKVLDFGLAKAMEPTDPMSPSVSQSPTITTPAMTQAGMILGTAAYMSPEQARGKPVDKRTDIWAFGCVLYEMLTGQRAFRGDSVADTLVAVASQEPDWDCLSHSTGDWVRPLVARCLDKDLRKRWHDIADVRVDLERILVAAPDALPRDVAKTRWHAGALWKLGGSIVMLVIAGVVGWALRAGQTDPVIRFTEALPQDQYFPAVNNTSIVAVSPDGSKIAYAASGGLYVRETSELDPVLLVRGSVQNPFFSSNGTAVGYFSVTSGELRRVASTGGTPVVIAAVDRPRGTPSWGTDNTVVFGQPDGVMRVSATGGSPELLVPGIEPVSPQLLPGGRALLFSEGDAGNPRVVVHSMGSDERKVLFSGAAPRYLPTGHVVYLANGVIYAVPFDVDTLETTGGAVPVVQGAQTVPPQYDVSATGALVYIPSGDSAGNRSLALVDRQGNVERLNVPANRYLSPRLSPDGRSLAVQVTDGQGASAIWVVDDLYAETQIRQLTTEGGRNIRPVWVDGSRIAYGSDRDSSANIYVQVADGSQPAEQVTFATDWTEVRPESWSEPQRLLSFSVIGSDDAAGLWTVSPDSGAGPERFYDLSDSVQRDSSFSPDGNWLAYTSNESGAGEVWVQPVPVLAGVKYRITRTGRAMALWAPDGKELFYRPSPATIGQTLHAVTLTTERGFGFRPERTLPIEGFVTEGGSRDYDITPDGQHFLMVFPALGDYPTRINVVLNWFSELKERVPVD